MIQFAANYLWLIPTLPLLACLFIGLLGYRLKGLAHLPAILAMSVSFLLALALLIGLGNGSLDPNSSLLKDVHLFEWFSAGNFNVPIAVTVDHLTALYLTFVTGIGLLIFIFAAGYMKGDYGYWRFFAYMSIFVFFMCTLVMGNNFILLYLGWEGVGLSSYLLIGYYYPRPAAVAAAKKAFITNRIGDFGLAIGIFLIYNYFGTVTYSGVFDQLASRHDLANLMPILQYIPFCIMLGAFGKSAQFPLHVWLPDAMEGPTPVSALIHAATMVTAGIYLIARTMPLFLMDPNNHLALDIVSAVGCFTAFLAATIALCQYDLKKIWAYSTLSQLGYMFLALGLCTTENREPAASAVFHVFTHAFFKALLFLSAGSVMHAMGGELDIRKMSGIRKVMPITNLTMLIGCLALVGIPPFAGFWSKDEILHAAFSTGTPYGKLLGTVGFLVALLTAFYTFRLYFKVFAGPLELPPTAGHHEPSPFALDDPHAGHADQSRDHPSRDREGAVPAHDQDQHAPAHHAAENHDEFAHTPNDGSPLLWAPLLVLALGALIAGFAGVFGSGEGGWIHSFLGNTLEPHLPALHAAANEAAGLAHAATQHGSALPYQIASSLIALIGIAVAFYFFGLNRHAAEIIGINLRPLVNFLYNKWYIDDLYHALLLRPLWILAHILSIFDRYVIDGVVFLVGFMPQVAGYSLKPTQRGLLQRYAVGMIAGLAIVVLGVLYLIYRYPGT